MRQPPLLMFMRLASIRQPRDKEKLAIFLSLHRVHISDALFGYLCVNVRTFERRVHVTGDHFQFNAVHSKPHCVDLQTHPFYRGRTFLLIKAVGRLDPASNVMRRAYELFFRKARRCVLVLFGPIFPVVLGTEMKDLGRRIAVANEILIPTHIDACITYSLDAAVFCSCWLFLLLV